MQLIFTDVVFYYFKAQFSDNLIYSDLAIDGVAGRKPRRVQ